MEMLFSWKHRFLPVFRGGPLPKVSLEFGLNFVLLKWKEEGDDIIITYQMFLMSCISRMKVCPRGEVMDYMELIGMTPLELKEVMDV
jgi:hypothetical protein